MRNLNLGVANITSVTKEGTRALCGCGTEFTIDPSTPYVEYEGKAYACCSQECHKAVSQDPAGAARLFQQKFAAR